jgi:hypothetical protein
MSRIVFIFLSAWDRSQGLCMLGRRSPSPKDEQGFEEKQGREFQAELPKVLEQRHGNSL